MSAIGLADNHLALEPVLIQRLKDTVPTLVEVGGVAHLDLALDNGANMPAAYVVWGGDQPGESPGGQGNPMIIRQAWQVVLLVKPQASGAGVSLAEAGALVASIIKTLTGWKAGDDVRALMRAGDQDSVDYAPGLLSIVLGFQAACIIRGAA